MPIIAGEQKMKHRMIVWFSCGAASAVAAKIAAEHYRDKYKVEVCYCDLLADEHPDNLRFLKDVERWIGMPIKILHSNKYQTVEQVFLGERFIVGQNGAPCTRLLKMQVRTDYQRPDDVHVLGYTSDEADRAAAFDENFKDLDCEWVLIDRGIDKNDCHIAIDLAGIKRPAMYDLGYNHNNCIGCVKGGMGYWNKIRRDFPRRFARMAEIEREIGHAINKDEDGPVWLDELDPERGKHDDLVVECGMFCEPNKSRIQMTITSKKASKA